MRLDVKVCSELTLLGRAVEVLAVAFIDIPGGVLFRDNYLHGQIESRGLISILLNHG